ncbi:hypothetical protein [Capnocytophaga canis]|uniref:Transglutaminase-like domain-containing protein n=1 Tax=Capnocytophaga canis TaxID=1848903 RepID=A0A0B7IRV1_9FLAO|nr:hypothetical protein [Capnocytophaga canis]CEN53339.1 conserved exported hypothetical protein [Capnocytophaga canis]
MRKLLLTLFVTGATLVGCSKSDDLPQEIETKASMTVKLHDTFENTLYSSLIYSFALIKDEKGNNAEYFEMEINSETDFDAKIKITNAKFVEETIIRKTIQKGNNKFTFSPKWKFDDLKNVTTSGNTYFSFEIIDEKTNKSLDNKDLQLAYRSINECVFAAVEDGELIDLSPLFTSYVNEDSPVIDPFLKEVGDFWKLAKTLDNRIPEFYGWAGQQLGDEYAVNQMAMIIAYLRGNNFTYSSITDTSNSSQKIFSQYVRFIDNTIKNKQANCVDGSVLLASIFKKIGFNTFLVLEPGHMYIGVELVSREHLYIETTAIGTIQNPLMDSLRKPNESKIIDIQEARRIGIKPIQ